MKPDMPLFLICASRRQSGLLDCRGGDGGGIAGAGSNAGHIAGMRQKKFATGQRVLAGSRPRLIVLIEAQLDAGIANLVPFDLVRQSQSWSRGSSGLTSAPGRVLG